ncbi:MAG TPA: crossover junction endodeoxyribonuclease RuvC [Candidatus Saccharicenans sp.]|jgi:crossover junction endodeoxyribonuclease RuvC|nr:crossover junction endodeoxyribonuclease RuvC [Candidatus Saccharicenans sp.]HRD02197.1 crossover junction endodeoxyribonuclease RuvC [Candidatus Saccharicenans sp.]
MRVLGIDPSLQSSGFGLIEDEAENLEAIVYGVIKPDRAASFPQKLNDIRTELERIIDLYSPQEIAIENPFYARNVKTAISLGQVRGAVLIAIASRQRQLYEYSALEIKKAVTGYGQAEKDQVQRMVKILLNLEDDRMPLDASDALATAICHTYHRRISFDWKPGRKTGKS